MRELDAFDGATVRRIDYLGDIHTDAARTDGFFAVRDSTTGFLHIRDARTARSGVQIYGDSDGNTWGEYRDPAEVFHPDSMASMEMNVITNDHPPDFVSSANVKDVGVGHGGSEVKRDGIFLVQDLLVTDEDTIKDVLAGKRQLSRGYTATLVRDSGVVDGQPFAARQTKIRGNHCAIVDRGRAGPECSIPLGRGDAFTVREENMKTKKITVDGDEHEVPVAVADAYEAFVAAQAAKTDDAKTDDAKTDAGLPFDVEEDEDSTDDASALRARIDVLEADRKNEGKRIDARVNLVTSARTVLGPEHKTDGVSDADLMTAVVVKVMPELRARLDANKSDPGYLRASFDASMDLHRRRESFTRDTNEVIFDAMDGETEGSSIVDEAIAYYDRYSARPMEIYLKGRD